MVGSRPVERLVMPDLPDPIQWSRDVQPPARSRRCATCDNAIVVEAIRAIFTEVASGRSVAVDRQVYAYIVEKFGYQLSDTSFVRHLKKCEGSLYAKATAARRFAPRPEGVGAEPDADGASPPDA